MGSVDSSMVTPVLEMLWLERELDTFCEIFIFWTIYKITKASKAMNSDPLSIILSRFLVILFQMTIIKALKSIW